MPTLRNIGRSLTLSDDFVAGGAVALDVEECRSHLCVETLYQEVIEWGPFGSTDKGARLVKKLVVAFALPLMLVACGGGPTPDPVAPGGGGGGDGGGGQQPETIGPFKEIKLYVGDKHILTMRKDGVIILIENNGHVGTLEPDGTVEITGNPKRIAKLAADGSITIDGQAEPVSVSENAELMANGQVANSLAEDGTVTGLPEGAPAYRWQGTDTPELRRYAMYILYLLTAANTEPPPDAGAPAPADGGDALKSDEEGEEEPGGN